MFRYAFLAFVLLASISMAGEGGDSNFPMIPSVTTTGHAEVHVKPDEAVISMGVQIEERKLQEAKAEADRAMRQILEVLKQLGVEEKDIQTDRLSVRPQYDHTPQGRQFDGYMVEQNLSVTVRNITDFEKLLSGALDNGANMVHGVTFRSSEKRKHMDKARVLAVQAAKQKAELLAGELGQAVGNPLTINEGGSHSPGPIPYGGARMLANVEMAESGASTDAVEGAVAPGQITYSANVSITFRLKDWESGEEE